MLKKTDDEMLYEFAKAVAGAMNFWSANDNEDPTEGRTPKEIADRVYAIAHALVAKQNM